MDSILQDIRYALRTLNRARGFAVIAVLTLALGIGANSAIFSVVNGVLLRPLPFAEPERLVRVYNENRVEALGSGAFSIPDFEDFQNATRQVYTDAASYYHQRSQTTARLQGEGRPEHLPIAYVSADFFKVLGVPAVRGRTISAEEAKQAARVVVLSHGAWTRRFSSDPEIVGRAIRLDNQPYTVVGIMPAGFAYPVPEVELYAPVTLMGPDMMGPIVRNNRWLSVIGRLHPGVTETAATTTSTQILARLEQDYPDTNKNWGIARVRGMQAVMVGDVRPALLVLLGVVALVLLIACANLANLLLARSTTRVREIAVRTALGASRERILRLVLTESLVLALVGGVAGFLLSLWGVRVLVAMAGDNLPRAESIRPDLPVVAFTLLVALVTGLIFGIVPAMRTARSATASRLREGGRGGTAGKERQRGRGALVVIESALAVVLLVSAGLMIKSFWRLTQVEAGFEAESTVRLHISVPSEVFDAPNGEEMVAKFTTYMRRIYDTIETVPGVLSIGGSKTVPLQGGGEPYTFGLPAGGANAEALQKVGAYIISPGFFNALNIPLLQGRDFAWNDQTAGVIVSRSLAGKLWPGEEPIGKRLLVFSRPIEVIGIVGNVKNEGLAAEQTDAVYVSMRSSPRGSQNIFIRTRGNPSTIIPAVREALWSVDPNQAIRSLETMREMKSETIARPQFFMTLIAIFGSLALALAAVGIYGVISYTVRQRTAEIGVRMALGADRKAVYQLVIGKAMQLALLGVTIGVAGALLLTQLMRALLFGVAPTDPMSMVAAVVILLLSAFLAAFIPAWRAARIPPAIAFRAE